MSCWSCLINNSLAQERLEAFMLMCTEKEILVFTDNKMVREKNFRNQYCLDCCEKVDLI